MKRSLCGSCEVSTSSGRVATMLHITLITALSVLVGGCAFAPRPGLSLNDAHVVEGPVLIERSGHVYLRYRRALEERGVTLLSLLNHKKERDAAYYFFSVPISHREWGNLIERPLTYDGTEELARKARVFWLDPDGSKHPIPLKQEANLSMQAPQPGSTNLTVAMSDEQILRVFDFDPSKVSARVTKGKDGQSTEYSAGADHVVITRSIVSGLSVMRGTQSWHLGKP